MADVTFGDGYDVERRAKALQYSVEERLCGGEMRNIVSSFIAKGGPRSLISVREIKRPEDPLAEKNAMGSCEQGNCRLMRIAFLLAAPIPFYAPPIHDESKDLCF